MKVVVFVFLCVYFLVQIHVYIVYAKIKKIPNKTREIDSHNFVCFLFVRERDLRGGKLKYVIN